MLRAMLVAPTHNDGISNTPMLLLYWKRYPATRMSKPASLGAPYLEHVVYRGQRLAFSETLADPV